MQDVLGVASCLTANAVLHAGSVIRGRTRRKLHISHPVEERPQAANARAELGHWEADTVAGQTGSSCPMTLTCRKSRLLSSLNTPRKTSAHGRDGMLRLPGALSPEPVRPPTPDRGKEFAKTRRNPRCAEQRSCFLSSAVRTGTPMGSSANSAPQSTGLECIYPAFFTALTGRISLHPRCASAGDHPLKDSSVNCCT